MKNFKGIQYSHLAKNISLLRLPILQRNQLNAEQRILSRTKSSKLPLLHIKEVSVKKKRIANNGAMSQLQAHTLYSNQSQLSSKIAIAEDIGAKVNNIIRNNQLLNQDYYPQDQQNFQQKIIKNKEILKQRRQLIQQQPASKKKNISRNVSKNQLKKGQKQLNQSIQLNSKVQLTSQSPNIYQLKSSLQSNHDKKKKSQNFGSSSNRLQKKMNELKQQIGKRKSQRQGRATTQGQQQKSGNIFDNIHNYLSNPHRLSVDLKFPKQNKNKRQVLQARLRDLQLRTPSLQPQKSLVPNFNTQSSKHLTMSSQWKRVQLNGMSDRYHKINVKQSNFQKQISHLGHLQQKNQHSLQRYIQNQRLLLDLKLVYANPNRLRSFKNSPQK